MSYKNPNQLADKCLNNDFKERQWRIVTSKNPMLDDYHTGIRTVNDIKTWNEILADDDEKIGQFSWGDFSREDAENALKNKRIKVYSSKPIQDGNFVSTSYVQALEYAGNDRNKVNEQEVDLDDIAWISGDEGQVAFKER